MQTSQTMVGRVMGVETFAERLQQEGTLAPPLTPGAGAAQASPPGAANVRLFLFRPTKEQTLHHALYMAMESGRVVAHVRKEIGRLKKEAAELRGQLLVAADGDERLAIRADLDTCTEGIAECEALAAEFEREMGVHRKLAGPLVPSSEDIKREAAVWAAWLERVEKGNE